MDTQNDLMREEKRRKVSENQDWSKLYPDLLRKIIESLSYIDFYRAKTVCSDWYSVWKTCIKSLYPWRIIYQDGSLMFFDPREDKLYTTKLLGLSDDSYFIASSGHWLLMVDSRLDFYIFNLVTCKRINLPSIESSIRGVQVKLNQSFEQEYGEWGNFVERFLNDHLRTRSAVLEINEKTGDYVVAWIFDKHYLFTHKKGDDSWWNWNSNLKYLDLAYKKNKLYLYTTNDQIKIIDFSGDLPKEEIERNPYGNHPFHYDPPTLEYPYKKRIVIQRSGEVLIILSLLQGFHNPKSNVFEWKKNILFYIFKMNFESGEWERGVDCIGDDEMLIFGHGVIIRAPPVQDLDDDDGIKNGSICFVKDDLWPGYKCDSYSGVFDLATSRVKWTKKFGVGITRSQWFVPGFS